MYERLDERGCDGGSHGVISSMMRPVTNKYVVTSLTNFTTDTSSELRARERDGSTIYATVYEARDKINYS